MEALAILRQRRLLGSLECWAEHVLAPKGFKPAKHHKLLIQHLEAVERGETKRLMVAVPPGSAKTTYCSVIFPVWYMARKERRDLILASHTAALAEDNSQKAMTVVRDAGGALGLSLMSESAKRWTVSNGGFVKAAGVNAAIAGRRAHLAIIDDPVKSRQHADSEVEREKTWNWYMGDVIGRLHPGASVILIMTRWHESDLAGRLIEVEGDDWTRLDLPAEAMDEDALGRQRGEFLWEDEPSYPYAQRLRDVKNSLEIAGASREWWSQYQQRPRSPDGSIFQTMKLGAVDISKAGTSVRAWDLAATAATGGRDPDWTAGVRITKTPEGGFVVDDVVRLRGGPEDVEAAVVATAQRDGTGVKVHLPQDPGQAGRMQVLYLTRKLAGFRVESHPISKDKATRAMPFASQVNVGNVELVRAKWNAVFMDELAGFPAGSHDDMVDAASDAFACLIAPPAPAKMMRIPWMGR